MNKIIYYIATGMLMSFININTIYNYNITTFDGQENSLSNFSGKSMLIVVLPSTHNQDDSLLLQQIDSLSEKYKDSLVIIGVPSYEDGFEDDSLQSLASWYKSLAGDSILITEGANTRKNSPYQSDLFEWLTNKDLNGHFDDDVSGKAAKYFINKSGYLYAELGAESSLMDETVETILQQNNY